MPAHLDDPYAGGPNWELESGRSLWNCGMRAGRYLVESDGSITVERSADSEDEVLAFHLINTVLAAALTYRGLLVLHASSVAHAGGTLAITGVSGAGKSTTAAALTKLGCPLVSDDVTALVSASPAGTFRVVAGNRDLYLAEDSALAVTYRTEKPNFRAWRRMKAEIDVAKVPSGFSASLTALYVLGTHDRERLEVTPLTGADKFAALLEALYLPVDPESAAQKLDTLRALAEQIWVTRLGRPVDKWTADLIADTLLAPAQTSG